jgi:uncharacterized membrane protein YbhN (UPF0104 family)
LCSRVTKEGIVRLLWLGPSSRAGKLTVYVIIAAVLFAGAIVGLSVIPGYGAMEHVLGQVRWPWFPASAGGVAAAFAGYVLAWQGIARAGGAPVLNRRQRLAAVLAGFGGFIGRGGSAIDRYAFLAAGADEREADVRLAGLDALEHVPLAVGCCAAAIYLLATGRTDPPPLDFVWPWAAAPPLGAAAAVAITARYRSRYRDARGWRRYAGLALDGMGLLWTLVTSRRCGPMALVGMTLFWAGEIFALWAGLAAFGVTMALPMIILADAIGYVLTRRAAPFGGAGFLDITLVMCLWACGAPLAAAIAGTAVYRFFSLFAPMPFCFAALPALRDIGGRQAAPSDEPAVQPQNM